MMRNLLAVIFLIWSAAAFAEKDCGEIEAIVRKAPEYPVIHTAGNHEGYAVVKFTVTTEGKVSNVKALDSYSEPTDRFAKGFSDSAVRAIEQWQFARPEKPCIHTQKFTFKLEQ